MNYQLQKLPIGIQDFESLRIDGYKYVDKTEHIYRLVSQGRYYFLSRPRRFGKSLLLSTIKALFLGKRELFKGLAIDSKADIGWEAHPVLYLDLNTNKYDKVEVLEKKLSDFLDENEALYGSVRPDLPLGMRFEKVIRAASEQTGQRVVILVDEYDKPLLQAIGNQQLLDEYRGILKGFYGALKSMDGCIKFALLTGVTKFSKVSVFSDLNNLEDISMLRQYYDICGMTEEELSSNFTPHIDSLAKANGLTHEECLGELRRRYDGYHFHQNTGGMYNPFSVLNTLKNVSFGSYWFETGTPTYLVSLLQLHHYDLEEMAGARITADELSGIDAEMNDPIPVIYQSGYLTIKGYNERFRKYILGFPNREVEEGFVQYLTPYYLSKERRRNAFDVEAFAEDVESGQPDAFCRRLQSLLASAPYDAEMSREGNFRNVIWVVFKMLGFYSETEYNTSDGRIDLMVCTPKYRYVMEFKLDGTAKEAMEQINSKDYTLPFTLDDRKTFKVGINFSSDTRTLAEWAIEEA